MHRLVLDDGSAACPPGQPASPRPASFFVPDSGLPGLGSHGPSSRPSRQNVWQSTQNTKGNSDLYVQSNVWVPGGTSGWHTHPGHSIITVTAGTVTAYEGDNTTCTPTVYTVGMTFVDKGGEHVHVIRTREPVEARQLPCSSQSRPAPRGESTRRPTPPARSEFSSKCSKPGGSRLLDRLVPHSMAKRRRRRRSRVAGAPGCVFSEAAWDGTACRFRSTRAAFHFPNFCVRRIPAPSRMTTS